MNCLGGMRPSRESITHFAPDNNWDVIFTQGNKTWIRHLIGWATVVHLADYARSRGEFPPHEGNLETMLMPVVIDDDPNGTPLPVPHYLENWGSNLDGTTFEIVPRTGKPQTSWRDRPWEPERP